MEFVILEERETGILIKESEEEKKLEIPREYFMKRRAQ